MSPTTPHPVLDSTGHPPVETIAEYLEELLPPTATARLREHFADCAECRDTAAALQEIQSLLGRTDTPAMPDDVALRIDAALAAEALLTAAPESVLEPAPEPAPDAAPAPRPSGTAPGSAGAPPRTPHGPSSGPADDTRRPRGGPGRGRARGWRRAALGVAALAVVGLVGTAVVQLGGESSSSGAKSSAVSNGGARPSVNGDLSSLGTLTDANLNQQVQGLLASATAVHPQGVQAPTDTTAHEAGTPVCALTAAARPGETPLTAAQGLYQGTPVTVLVYTDTAHPLTSVDAYLVDSSCRAGVLLHRTVPR